MRNYQLKHSKSNFQYEQHEVSQLVLIINPKGFLNVIVSLGTALGLRVAGYIDPQPALIMMGALLFVIDVAIRRPQGAKDLFHPDDGGHFFFIPMWIIGIIAMVGYAFIWT